MNLVRAFVQRHPVVANFALAYAFTWAVELPLVASAQGWSTRPISFAWHYVASFGPALAALVVIALSEGQTGLRTWLSGLLRWRGRGPWLLFAVLAPLVLFAIATIINIATTNQSLDLALLGEVDYLPYLGVAGAFALWLLTFGLGEELGWRGFALPRLQRRFSALVSTLILGVLWAFWHLPAFFYKDTYMAMGLAGGLPMLTLSIIAAAIVFTWLYNGSRGSLLVVALFHALFDFLSVSRAGGESAPAIMSAAVMVWAVILVARRNLVVWPLSD